MGYTSPPSYGMFGNDPLSAPSGFMAHNSNAGTPPAGQVWQPGGGWNAGSGMALNEGQGPPRKRLRGMSHEVLEVMDSPESPGIQRPGHKRRRPQTTEGGPSLSDDESLPDTFGGSRIVRGRADSTASPIAASPSSVEDQKFTRFSMVNPFHSKALCLKAWQQANGDAARATALLGDEGWKQANNRPGISTKSSPQVSGRVKGVDEVNRAQRAAHKEMSKNSLIHSLRPVNRTTPPPISKATLDTLLSPTTPTSPDVALPRIKRHKKVVIDSDSDVSVSEVQQAVRRQKVISDESKALEYFNTAGPAGLQELTGMCRGSSSSQY